MAHAVHAHSPSSGRIAPLYTVSGRDTFAPLVLDRDRRGLVLQRVERSGAHGALARVDGARQRLGAAGAVEQRAVLARAPARVVQKIGDAAQLQRRARGQLDLVEGGSELACLWGVGAMVSTCMQSRVRVRALVPP